MHKLRLACHTLLAVCMAGLFFYSVQCLKDIPKQTIPGEIEVALPLFIQVGLAGGDRNLAANIAAIRAVVVAPEKMQPDEFKVLAKIQKDVSWLNPRHEDNYYTAAAILPWNGQLDAAQVILYRAMLARPFDYQPSFYYAFDLLHFMGDSIGASQVLREAASKLPAEEDARLMMENLSAKWMDRADDVDMAIVVVSAMAKQTQRNDFRKYLEMRVDRLRMLKHLRESSRIFEQRMGRPLGSVQELVATGLIPAVPVDPFGLGFEVDAKGTVILKN